MKNVRIKVDYSQGMRLINWEGTLLDCMDIALGEIFEHAGGDSPAYAFTKAIFDKVMSP